MDGTIELVIDGTLDLHTFKPGEVKFLIPDYLNECLARKIYHVRIIHGKGTGVMRRTVHSILNNLPYVKTYSIADETAGSWGATVVVLQAVQPPSST